MALVTRDWNAIAATAVTSCGVLVALCASVWTFRQTNRLKRAEWFLDTTMEFHKDPRLVAIFDAIQYGRFTFNSSHDAGSDLGSEAELELVYWLDFLNAIGDAVAEGLLSIPHLRSGTLGYAIEMTLANDSVEKYLLHVASYDLDRKSEVVSWGFLRRQYHESFSYLRRLKDDYAIYESQMKRGGVLHRFRRWLKTL